jgi:hypothetical protein
MNVLAYKYSTAVPVQYMIVYWRIYVSMYRLEYIYQCIRINLTAIGKEFRNKMYLEI